MAAEFVDSLLKVYSQYEIRSRIQNISGPRLAHARNLICEAFLDQTHAEWLWMVDDDMTFEPDAVAQLMNTGKKLVGALCFSWNAADRKASPVLIGPNGRITNYPKNALTRVTATGAACLLIHRSVLEDVRSRRDPDNPYIWFQDTVRDGREFGEDAEFCLRAKAAGHQCWVHTGVKAGHVKQLIVGERDFVA